MAILYCAENVYIVEMQPWIPTLYFCLGQESEFECIYPSPSLAMQMNH